MASPANGRREYRPPAFGAAPEAIIDPEEAIDRLPQPYRFVNRILLDIVNAAEETIFMFSTKVAGDTLSIKPSFTIPRPQASKEGDSEDNEDVRPGQYVCCCNSDDGVWLFSGHNEEKDPENKVAVVTAWNALRCNGTVQSPEGVAQTYTSKVGEIRRIEWFAGVTLPAGTKSVALTDRGGSQSARSKAKESKSGASKASNQKSSAKGSRKGQAGAETMLEEAVLTEDANTRDVVVVSGQNGAEVLWFDDDNSSLKHLALLPSDSAVMGANIDLKSNTLVAWSSDTILFSRVPTPPSRHKEGEEDGAKDLNENADSAEAVTLEASLSLSCEDVLGETLESSTGEFTPQLYVKFCLAPEVSRELQSGELQSRQMQRCCLVGASGVDQLTVVELGESPCSRVLYLGSGLRGLTTTPSTTLALCVTEDDGLVPLDVRTCRLLPALDIPGVARACVFKDESSFAAAFDDGSIAVLRYPELSPIFRRESVVPEHCNVIAIDTWHSLPILVVHTQPSKDGEDFGTLLVALPLPPGSRGGAKSSQTSRRQTPPLQIFGGRGNASCSKETASCLAGGNDTIGCAAWRLIDILPSVFPGIQQAAAAARPRNIGTNVFNRWAMPGKVDDGFLNASLAAQGQMASRHGTATNAQLDAPIGSPRVTVQLPGSAGVTAGRTSTRQGTAASSSTDKPTSVSMKQRQSAKLSTANVAELSLRGPDATLPYYDISRAARHGSGTEPLDKRRDELQNTRKKIVSSLQQVH